MYFPSSAKGPSEINAFAEDAFRFSAGMYDAEAKWDPSTRKDHPKMKHPLLAVEKLAMAIQKCADGITEEVPFGFQGIMDIAQSFCTLVTRIGAIIKISPNAILGKGKTGVPGWIASLESIPAKYAGRPEQNQDNEDHTRVFRTDERLPPR